MFEYMIIAWAGVLGLLLGGAMSRAISRKVLKQARQLASQKVDEAREAATLTLREMKARAREEALQLRKISDEQVQQASEENTRLKERTVKLEARYEKLDASLSVHQSEQSRREQAILKIKSSARDTRQEAKEKRLSIRGVLEQTAETTAREMRNNQAEAIVEEHRAQCADRLRNLEATDGEEFARQAKRLMGIAMGRHCMKYTAERTSFNVPLPPGGGTRLADNPEFMEAVEEQCGVRWSLSDSGESVRLEGGDGVARELARRSLARFTSDKKMGDAKQLVTELSDQLSREINNRGARSFRNQGIKLPHVELVNLVGRLYYRTSYTQNQWEHAIESSYLAGLMAAELGLDVRLARRGTLLHDIGKALTHEIEGSHAVIGAELARKYGESELMANAIGSHHGDEPANSPYALLVAAADAMSGARPGARREITETYGDRIGDLERIANHFKGVTSVHAVQAGRELRVHVDERQVNDARAAKLSEEIAEEISEKLTFPGQIRVIVIREFKAVDIAC